MPQPNFKRGQQVAIRTMAGPNFAPEWTERAKLTGKSHTVSPTSGTWWVVRYPDGGGLSIHETQLRSV